MRLILAAVAAAFLCGCSSVSSMFSWSPAPTQRRVGNIVEQSGACQGRNLGVGSPEWAQCMDQARAAAAARSAAEQPQ
jgi:hypothetical protein